MYIRGGGKKCILCWFPKGSLDVTRGREYRAPSEDQSNFLVVIYLRDNQRFLMIALRRSTQEVHFYEDM